MTRLAALTSGLLALAAVSSTAAPIPKQSGPSLAGKYTLLTSSTLPTGKGAFGDRGGPAGAAERAAALEEAGFRSSSGPLGSRRDTVITADRITIDGRTATWDYRLDADAKPMAIDLTITPVRGKATKHLGIVEVDRDRLTIVYAAEGQERPKSADDAKGVSVYVFQKAPPPPRSEYRVLAVTAGKEEELEKELNRLAGEGFEVVFATSGSGSQLVLKRTKP